MLPWSTKSLSGQLTQITKIAKITSMITNLQLILKSQMVWIARLPKYLENYLNDHKPSTHIKISNGLNDPDYQNTLINFTKA